MAHPIPCQAHMLIGMARLRFCSDKLLEGSSLSLWAPKPGADSFHQDCEADQIDQTESNVTHDRSVPVEIHVWDYSIK